MTAASWVLLAGPGTAANGAEPAGETAATLEQHYANDVKPVLLKYCGDCHFDGAAKGDLNLDRFASLASVQAGKVEWQKVADNLHTRSMPPAKRAAQPSDAERRLVRDWVAASQAFIDFSAPRDPGRVTIRRLNRVEYANTVRDLLGIPDFAPAADFPADDTGYGFDNNADVLTMSPLLVEKYLAAAEAALDRVIVTEPQPPATVAKMNGAELKGNGGGGAVRTLATAGEAFGEISFPSSGRYTVRVEASADQAGGESARVAVRVDGTDARAFDVTTVREAPRWYEAEVAASAGPRRVGVAFLNDYYNEHAFKGQRDRNLHVHAVEIVGPLDASATPAGDARRKILFAEPGKNGLGETDAAMLVLAKFAGRAYRRPASPEEVGRLSELFASSRAAGESFERAIKHALSAVLVSPSFLFRVEREQSDDPAKPYFISEHELATRLSYFLWSSIPDDALAALAAAGRLRESGTLKAEVRRMLADPKASALVENFVGQWLVLRNLEHHSVSKERFPDFEERLRADMRREVELFFANVIGEDRSVLELLDSDYTFANERLAKLYGIAGVAGDEFRRVSLTGTPRGGVTTMAGVLTVTAMPSRTSPVKRGKFVLEQLFASPPPPPPPSTPSLAERGDGAKGKSVRQRFEAHRSDPTCVACHTRMDPIGFAMENFDAIGRWRADDAGVPIDAAGTLPEGESFNGPVELRKVLLGRKDEFVRCLVEKMLTYALGRGMETSDRRIVKEIADAVARDGYRFSALIDHIVASDAFQKRRAKRPTGMSPGIASSNPDPAVAE